MLHPSYYELIDNINKDRGDEYPEIESRYTIVIASAKRARQLISGEESNVKGYSLRKPLSVAVEELNTRQVRILGNEENEQL